MTIFLSDLNLLFILKPIVLINSEDPEWWKFESPGKGDYDELDWQTVRSCCSLTWCCWKQNINCVRLTPAECIADFRSVLNCFIVYPLPMLSVTSLARCRAETTETAARRPTPELPAKRRDPPGADRTLSHAAQRSNTSATRWRSSSRLSRENNTEAASQYNIAGFLLNTTWEHRRRNCSPKVEFFTWVLSFLRN